MDYAETSQRIEAVIKSATELHRNDIRMRSLIDWSVAEARGQLGRYIDPENADEEAFDLAHKACALLAARIFTEDAELAALRLERDHYQKLVERGLMLHSTIDTTATHPPLTDSLSA